MKNYPQAQSADQYPAMTFPTDFCMIIDFCRDIVQDDFILLLIQKVCVNPRPDALGWKILCLTSLVEVEGVRFCNTDSSIKYFGDSACFTRTYPREFSDCII